MQRQMTAGAAALIIVVSLAGLWFLEIVDASLGGALDGFGIQARDPDGLPGIVVAPFLHAGFDHLISNSLPFAVLGFLVLLGGFARWVWSSLISVVTSGLTAWLLTPANTIILGASGLIFGWLTYLLFRGFYSRKLSQVLVAAAVLVVYGGMIWGVFPSQPGVSWQAHLGGAVGGVIAARLLHRRALRPAPAR